MSNLKVSEIIRLIIRLSLGVFFIVTAALKLFSIDNLEVYIYSFGIFSYTWTTFFSRLLIFCELLVGISLVFKVYFKQIWWLSMLMMVGFTLFLVYAAIYRNDSNCHCFGSIIELDPMQSVVKNIVIIALLFVIRKEESHDYKPLLRKWLVAATILVSLVIPFIIVPMDVIYNKIISEKENINTMAFYESLNDSTYVGYLHIMPERLDDSVVFVQETRLMDVTEGRYLINYALAGCRYCHVGAEKLTLMLDRHQIPHDKVKFVVGGNDIMISRFITMTKTFDYEHWKIAATKLMPLTFGRFPIYVFVENGEIVKAGDFRILDDKDLVEFLK